MNKAPASHGRSLTTVPRGNWYSGNKGGIKSTIQPIDLSYSNYGRDGYVRAGLSFGGGNGIHAYYDRHRYHYDHDHHHHHYVKDYYYGGIGYCGEFFGGVYYPYGYGSYYDVYYHRYPYNYVTVYDDTPHWTVYVETPATETVYVQGPERTVYVESSTDVEQDPNLIVGEELVGPPLPAGTDVSRPPQVIQGGEMQVQPQDRIPVNNAWLATGAKELHDRNLDTARQAFAYAVLEEPQNGFAELSYGLVHFLLGDYEAAAEAIRRGLSRAPDVIDRPIDIAQQLGDSQMFSAALGSAHEHVGVHRNDGDAWFILGYVLYSSGKPVEAAKALDKAVSLKRSDSYAAVLRDAAKRVRSQRHSSEQ